MANQADTYAVEESLVREDIFAHLNHQYKIEICSYRSVYRGLMNWKWVVTTPSNKLFIKCFHPKRYRLTEQDRRTSLSRALSFQQILHDQAKVCPNVLSFDGEYIVQSPEGYMYVVMEHDEGAIPSQAGCMNAEFMFQAGHTVGRMHGTLSRYPREGASWTPNLKTMKEKWQIQLDNANDLSISNAPMKRALERQGEILAELDLSMFDELEPGWAHWDLWVDNMLVGEDGEIRLVDFDSIQFGYPEIDVARVILSGALREGKLHPGPTAAFLKGYREQHTFPIGRLAVALKLLWCREAHWWLKTDIDTFSTPPRRFAEELMWLTEQWDRLELWFGPDGVIVK